MSSRKASGEFVTSFSTGWPENQPDVLILSLVTHTGTTDFAMSPEQAQLIAKTMRETADHIAKSAATTRRGGAPS